MTGADSRPYDLAIRYKSGDAEFIAKTDSDIISRLPGNAAYDDAVHLPGGDTHEGT